MTPPAASLTNPRIAALLREYADLLELRGESAFRTLAYRRGHEAQADCFAIALLHGAGIAARPMADLLLVIDTDAARRAGAHGEGGWATLVSTHPDTAERARRIRAGAVPSCS